jgi:hypothetical protein
MAKDANIAPNVPGLPPFDPDAHGREPPVADAPCSSVGIETSTGGLEALTQLMQGLPRTPSRLCSGPTLDSTRKTLRVQPCSCSSNNSSTRDRRSLVFWGLRHRNTLLSASKMGRDCMVSSGPKMARIKT